MRKLSQFTDIDRILAKVLAKEANVDEIMAFSEWVNESAKNQEEMEILSEYWDAHADRETIYAEISYNKNKDHIFGKDVSSSTGSKPRRHRTMILLSVAASLFVAIMMGAYWYVRNVAPSEKYILLSQDGIENFTLPDSSKVVLNKNSRLTYTNRFLIGNRIVTLEGEGYFEVVKKSREKFIVQVGNSQIEVLGTKFNVDARHADERIVTTLVEGSVLFRNKNQQLLMTPNHQLTFYTRSGLMENVKTDAYADTEWKDNIFRYHSILMQELADQLGEHYGIEIILDKKYSNIRVSGAFQKEQSLEKILSVMQKSIDFRWKMKDNKILIY